MLYEAKQGSKAYEYIKGVLDAEFEEHHLIKAYKEVCKDNEDQRIIIKCLQERLKNTCDGKEE